MKATKADERIEKCLAENASFLLDAGAGSGKTTSLVCALNHIRGNQRKSLRANSQSVACITFTNVAKDEISERTEHDSLFQVSTIHDFLWGCIKPFQSELKAAVATLNLGLSAKSRRRKDPDELQAALKNLATVSYSDRGSNFLEGRIFHDDLLEIAHIMFASYPALSRLVAAKFPFIFVDEYQDTNQKVIEILLDHVIAAPTRPVIGFFGDKMQSIYSDGVGELRADYKEKLILIQKEENYRCATSVIDVLNKIRSDIRQVPAGENQPGSAVYLNLSNINSDEVVDVAKGVVRDRLGWNFKEENLRALFLTHRLIARKAGYEQLWSAYNQRGGFWQEQFQGGEDPVSRFLCDDIDALIEAWTRSDQGSVITILNKHRTIIASRQEKERVSGDLNRLIEMTNKGATIGDVLGYVRSSKLMPILDQLAERLDAKQVIIKEDGEPEKDGVFFAALFAVPFKQVTLYRAVLERNMPYSTKHGVKGDEFDTVFVVLDDAGANWSQYSFSNLLAASDTNEARVQRTRNLFYVCCSRAKRNLAVIDLAGVGSGRATIEALFGAENCMF